jgi:SAM-dependent methyltransferase
MQKRKFLNVGGADKFHPVAACFQDWEHILLDIDPKGMPDIVADARELSQLPGTEFDAIYCSHNLEHYYRHDAIKVLQGFDHVLNETGFAYIMVPDLMDVMRQAIERKLDIDDVLYTAPAGPITVRDVVYGHGGYIERSGQDFYAHKTGFTEKSLHGLLKNCGFSYVFGGTGGLQILCIAFKTKPTEEQKALLGLPSIP